MVVSPWYIRTSSEEIDPINLYGRSSEFFSLRINHGGVFTKKPGRVYLKGKIHYVDMINADAFSVHEVTNMIKELGYLDVQLMWYHFKNPESCLDNGLQPLYTDQDVVKLTNFVDRFKIIDLYIEHSKTTDLYNEVNRVSDKKQTRKRNFDAKKVVASDSDNPFDDPFFTESQVVNPSQPEIGNASVSNAVNVEPKVVDLDAEIGDKTSSKDKQVVEEDDDTSSDKESGNDSDSDSETDSEFEVDEEDSIVEPEVDMGTFLANIDKNVEWVGCAEKIVDPNPEKEQVVEVPLDMNEFDSGTDEENESERSKALKKIRKEHSNPPENKGHLFIGQTFANKEKIREMIQLVAVQTRRQLSYKKNDDKRVRVICKGNIPIFSLVDMFGHSESVVNSGSNAASGSSGPSGTIPTRPNVDTGSVATGPSRTIGLNCRDTTKWSKSKVIAATSPIKDIGSTVNKKKDDKGTNTNTSDKTTKASGSSVNIENEKDHISCPWVVHISKGDTDVNWTVKTFNDNHRCLQTREVKWCTAEFLSKDVEDHDVKPEALKGKIETKYNLGVSKYKVYRAKVMARDRVHGDYTQQYKLLRDYILELQARNPETTVKLDVATDPNPNKKTVQFKRIYVCLGPLKRGFRVGGRELLGLDGCHMKGLFPGQILTAVGIDPNNGTYPLAYGIVESESTDSWTWFMSCLGEDLELNTMSNFTFMSDRQKGIIPAIANLFPCAEHRYCVRHIYSNMKSRFRGNEYKQSIWQLATATTVPEFDKGMEEVKKLNKEAYDWLKDIPARHWSRSHFSGRAQCDVLLNNMCEVFNRRLVDGRDKPIITCLEFIREYLMKRIVIVQKLIGKCDGPLTPSATKLFTLIKKEASKYKAIWNGGNQYQVTYNFDKCVVDVTQRYCSCRKWEITGMPCKHGVAAMWEMVINSQQVGIPESYVSPCYWLTTWKAMYNFKIGPVSGDTTWPKSLCPLIICPPKHHVQVGRPRKNRRKTADEIAKVIVKGNKLGRVGGTVTCKICKVKGHNRRSCKGPGNPGVGSTSNASVGSGPENPGVSAKVGGQKRKKGKPPVV